MLKKSIAAYNRFEKAFCGIFLLAIILVSFYAVVLRFVFNRPQMWPEEYVLLAFIWVIYMGCSAATGEKKHISVTMLVNSFPPGARFVADIATQLLWFLCGAIFLYSSAGNTVTLLNRGSFTPATSMPYWIIALAVPVGMCATCLRVLGQMITTIAAGPSQYLQKEEKGE